MSGSQRQGWIGSFIAALLLLGLAVPAFASWMIPPAPYRPKDFTVVKRNGLYHLFYIRNNPTLPAESTQVDFGHATSRDLYFWQHHAPVVPSRPGRFDRSHVWAPSIVQRDGVYYMFYTGVSDSLAAGDSLRQQIGLATSTDLYQWNALEDPILDPSDMPWAWDDPGGAVPFRDPFVMEDPTTPGRWLQLLSAAPASDPGGMIVAVAGSDGDFTQWTDLGALWISHRSWTFNEQIESPHMFEHGGLWYLFFTTSSGQPITFVTSPDPLAPPPQWTYRGRLATMLGANTVGWFASEQFDDGLLDYFAFVNGDRVEILRMVWGADWTFQLAQPDLFHVQQLYWMSGSVRPGQSVDFYIQSAWWSGRALTLDCFWKDSSGVLHPVSRAALGVPEQIALTGDLTRWTWLARALPDSVGAPAQAQIVLRTQDQTATSNAIQLLPANGNDPGIDPPPDLGGDPGGSGGGVEELREVDAQPKLRTLKQSAFGARPSVLVDLPESMPVKLEVFDLQGRRVRLLADRVLPSGGSVLAWDGRDGGGMAAPRGIYFARLITPARVLSTRVLLR